MVRCRAIALAAGLAAVASFTPAPAPARLWSWAQCGTDASDFDAINLVINKLLDEDAVGASRPWTSTSGHTGHVLLLAGGKKAGSSEGKVRITRLSDGREKTLFTFKYRETPGKGWATCG